MASILLITTGYDGHPLELTPLIRAAGKAGELHLVGNADQARFIGANKYIERFYLQDDVNINSLATYFGEKKFDKIVAVKENTFSDNVRMAMQKPKARKGFFAALMSAFKKEPIGIDLIAHTVQKNNFSADTLGIDHEIPAGEMLKAHDLPISHSAGYYTIVLDNELVQAIDFPELFGELDHPVILIGDANFTSLAAKIATIDSVKIYNALGKFSFNEMADIVRNSKLVITGVNDFFYIATAHKRKIIVAERNAVKPNLKKLYPLPSGVNSLDEIVVVENDLLHNKGQVGFTRHIKKMLAG